MEKTTATPAIPKLPPLTFREKMNKIQSLIATSRIACLHLNDNADTDFYGIGETLSVAEHMVSECADEYENMA